MKVDIESKIRQFEQQISAAREVQQMETDQADQGQNRRSIASHSEEDIPRSSRVRPATHPKKPPLNVEVIAVKPAGRDISLLDSAVRYRSSSSPISSSSRPLKSCLKKSYSELVGPEPGYGAAQLGAGWRSSDDISKNERKISFAERVQETAISPLHSDSEDSIAESDRRRSRSLSPSMSSSESSIDEGSYRVGNVAVSTTISRRGRRTEHYVLPSNVLSACRILSGHLEGRELHSNTELDSALATVAGAWFAASSHKAVDPQQVADYISAYERISPQLRDHIVVLVDGNGNSALHYAVSQANFDVVDLLLEVEAVANRVDTLNRAGYSALMLASLAEPENAVQRAILTKLFRLGNVDARSAQAHQTALMLSAAHGRLAVVDLLLACGADPNCQDADGSTALMTAAEHGYVDVVKVLIQDPRTDPHLVDSEGSTALSIALNAGAKDVGLLLYGKMDFSKNKQSVCRQPLVSISKFSSLLSLHFFFYFSFFLFKLFSTVISKAFSLALNFSTLGGISSFNYLRSFFFTYFSSFLPFVCVINFVQILFSCHHNL